MTVLRPDVDAMAAVAVAFLVGLLVLTSCATVGDLEQESVKREALEKGAFVQGEAFSGWLNRLVERVEKLENQKLEKRVFRLESATVSNTSETLQDLNEDPELYDKMADEAAEKTNRQLCIKGKRNNDTWLIAVACKKGAAK